MIPSVLSRYISRMVIGYMIMIPLDFHSWHISPIKAGYVILIFSDFQSWHIIYIRSGPPFMTDLSHLVRLCDHCSPGSQTWHISHIMSIFVIKILSDFHGWLHISHIKSDYVIMILSYLHSRNIGHIYSSYVINGSWFLRSTHDKLRKCDHDYFRSLLITLVTLRQDI
jgi:hypothetical protein